MYCPSCGHEDQLDLGFCTSCGMYFRRETYGSGLREGTVLVIKEPELTYEQLVRYTITGLVFTILMGLFIFAYLSMNQADPLLIVFVELFPALWFVLLLLQWQENKGKTKKAK
jgi:hypothetical protein